MAKQKQFKSWDEVKEYLEEDDNNRVYYHVWCFGSKSYGCEDGCCYDTFENIKECIETIKDFSGDYTKVTKY